MNVLESFSLKGRVAMVTGAGDPQGYGAQCAIGLWEAGATVYIAARSDDRMKAFCANYPGMRWKHLDMSVESEIKAIIPAIVEECGHFDILVNNAVSRAAVKKWDLSMDDFEKSLRVNGAGLYLITREAALVMKKQHKGAIVNIGSYLGTLGLNHTNYDGTGMQTDSAEWPSPAYAFEKGGMANFTRWAASILGPDGIRVNHITLIGCSTQLPPEKLFTQQHANNTLLRRICNETDLKGGVVYLASDASAFVTGATLPIDGGYSAV